MMRGIVGFLDERFGSNAGARFLLRKIYPDHWSFYLGEFALYTFALLVVTGVWLTFVYQANDRDAYASVVALSPSTPIGYLMRQVHHWSAVTFVAAILIHMARIFFTAAFRKPRELNWVVGLTMLILASLTGLTGYSLPNDALSGTGLRIVDAIVLAVPFVGAWAANVLNGGGYPGPLLLQHLYTIHVYFLPVIIGLLLAAHLGMVVLQKHTQFVPEPQNVVGRRFWPDYALRTVAALGITVAVILALAATIEINPIGAYGPYSDWTVSNPAVPDWYAAFLDGALRLGPALEMTIFGHPIPAIVWPGIVLPAIVFVVLFLWPWIDAAFTHNRVAHDVLVPPTFAPWRVGFGSALIAGGIFLTLAASDDQQALVLHQPVQSMVTFYRVLVPFGALVVGIVAAQVARELRSRSAAHGTEAERVITLRRNDAGGFDEEAIGPV